MAFGLWGGRQDFKYVREQNVKADVKHNGDEVTGG
jgi:hypothetical protein